MKMIRYMTPLMIASTFALSACQSVAQTDLTKLQKKWQLSQYQHFTSAQLQKTSMDWTHLPNAHAYMGCNQLNFQTTLDGKGGIQVGMMASTRMYCGNEMKLESQFTTDMPKMKHYRLENQGKTLILDDGAGQEMRFTAQ